MSMWDGTFQVNGSLRASGPSGAEDVPLPRVLTTTWLPRSSEIMLYGQKALGNDRASTIGVYLGTDGSDANKLSSIYVIQPGPDFKSTITFGFVFAHPLAFLAAPVGSSQSSQTVNGWFFATAHRTSSVTVTIEVDPAVGQQGRPWFRHGRFSLTLSPWAPPWQNMEIGVTIVSDGGRVDGDIELTRTNGH
jgi:hypothetical protein